MKKRFLVRALAMAVVCALLVGVVGCGGGATGGDTADAGELNLFIWTEYIPESVIDDFQAETGIKVNATTYSSNEDMLNKVKTDSPGTYDIVQPSDYMIKMMIEQNLLQELDLSQVPNFSNIAEQYTNQEYDPGNKYSVPYMAGMATLCYNKDLVPIEITSYADLWKPEVEGQVLLLDDFRQVVGMVGQKDGFGINATEPDQLTQMKADLLALKPNVKAFDSDNPKSLLISGEVGVAYTWSAEIALAMRENPSIVPVPNPTEGAGLFLDNFAIPVEAKNVENAYKFMDYILSPEVSASISAEYPYVNPNAAAVELLDDEYKNNPVSNPDPAVFQNGQYIQPIGDVLEEYNAMWTEFKK
ncbi:MAG: spermidine/putrescine ABC transporter substrate-binding protein [Actinomycetes bacterium]|nr:spermidine/putrescine ABC transporter substrate-binding protein [Actinomycetes bacterium]